MKVEGGREGRKEDGARMVPRITEMGKRWRSQIGLSNKVILWIEIIFTFNE
jgi:hypothetical protein